MMILINSKVILYALLHIRTCHVRLTLLVSQAAFSSFRINMRRRVWETAYTVLDPDFVTFM